ncbi:MAG: hypothetical protein HY870_12405 [Chloroflexi bacterium]|nr:hypothetical protein [Chloroflexota bacterium]
MSKHLLTSRIRLLVVFGVVALALNVASVAQSSVPHLGYGFNVAEWDITRLQTMGFNWIKIFDVPISPLPMNVLVRVEVNAQTSVNDLLADLDLKLVYRDNVAAWEIGNEVNLDASYGWNAAPDAAAYADRLCAAYDKIKTSDPDAIVVSAGLAPVGRVQDSWNGHPGHNGAFQDEREFLKELLAAGGDACLDVVGLHPYGFSADYDAVPEVSSGDPTQNCNQGLCFRTAEKFYEVMQAQGLGDKKIWATEFGWITQPPDHCLNDPSWTGRHWQIVPDEKQASNLAGAFQYADAHWPWMGAMFIFNLNFYSAPWYTNDCEQMLWYSVRADSPAESALTSLVKNIPSPAGRLRTETSAIKWLVDVDEQPVALNASVDLANWGWQSLVYTATVDPAASLVPTIISPTGSLSATAVSYLTLSMPAFTRALGAYTGTLTLNWYAAGAGNNPRLVALQVDVVSEVYFAYLPAVLK